MLSIVLYGRNDSYGYNLHKRAALSFNCMAELLSDPDDEILFVDYNTPDDYPTFPEAIADTLTQKAVERIRVLRVRPGIHARYKSKTHLVALEPIARNVAVRRSNPNNRWILSTNTDMIFVPRVPLSLGEMTADLPNGIYHLPRFEIPESLWEGFDRKDPGKVLALVEQFGRGLHLNEIVLGREDVKFDGPGDFQLMLRDDLFRIHGFHEEMLRGWHVDANISKRMFLIYGKIGDLLGQLYGYHCDHTRQVTPAHKGDAVENSIAEFVDELTVPEIPAQAESWGCAEDRIEEISLRNSAHQHYVRALTSAIKTELSAPPVRQFRIDSFGTQNYDAAHVMPFLADAFASAPREHSVGWIGGRRDTFELFADVWSKMGFRAPILLGDWCAKLLSDNGACRAEIVSEAELAARADAFVFDFGRPSVSPNALDSYRIEPSRLDHVIALMAASSFEQVVETEQSRLAQGRPLRRIVAVDAIHNQFEGLVANGINAARAPFATRLRQGFAQPAPAMGARSVFAQMRIGPAGQKVVDGIASVTHKAGHVAHGPYLNLAPGRYEVEFFLEQPHKGLRALVDAPAAVVLEVNAGEAFLNRRPAIIWRQSAHKLAFTVPNREGFGRLPELVEFRLWRRAGGRILLKDVILRNIETFARKPNLNADQMLYRLGITAHLIPLLTDIFASAPRAWSVGWVGGRRDTFEVFADLWSKLGFQGSILLAAWSAPLLYDGRVRRVEIVGEAEIATRADAFIFDFGLPSLSSNALDRYRIDPSGLDEVVARMAEASFHCILENEQARLVQGCEPRPVVAVDATSDRFKRLVSSRVSAASAPVATVLQQGLAIRPSAPPKKVRSVLAQLHAGPAGRRTERGIVSATRKAGHVAYGPYLNLAPGRYEVEFVLERGGEGLTALLSPPAAVVLEVNAGDVFLKRQPHIVWRRSTHKLAFTVPKCEGSESLPGLIEFRLWRHAGGQVLLKDVILEEIQVFAREPNLDADQLLALLGIVEAGSHATVTPWETPAKLRAHS